MARLVKRSVTGMAACMAFAGMAKMPTADANGDSEKTARADPAQIVLSSREASAYEAWKSKDAKFWASFLADKFVGWGASGRLDKRSAAKEYTGTDCDIQRYAVSNVQLTPLSPDAALITHKTTVDGACGGQRNPDASWAASVYVRDGSQWRAIFHAEAAIVDPGAPMAKPLVKKADGQASPTTPEPDPRLAILLPREQAIWEAWKDHDARKLDALTASNMQFINIFGVHLATKSEALQDWSGEGCDVKTVKVFDAAATMLSPTLGILTFHATADGTCFGQQVGPVWGSSIYVKQGDAWKWTFGINLPARFRG